MVAAGVCRARSARQRGRGARPCAGPVLINGRAELLALWRPGHEERGWEVTSSRLMVGAWGTLGLDHRGHSGAARGPPKRHCVSNWTQARALPARLNTPGAASLPCRSTPAAGCDDAGVDTLLRAPARRRGRGRVGLPQHGGERQDNARAAADWAACRDQTTCPGSRTAWPQRPIWTLWRLSPPPPRPCAGAARRRGAAAGRG